ncbi:MAG: DUF3536 domain-containing protein [Parachlamydiales bacterium]|nr:DUF3536 domain-containing protein [Parachlamydiales bacterium]
MNRFITIHAHFYQPPRENPWLEEIEQQDSAFPFHDWNEKICAECYAPNGAARIVDSDQSIIDIVNNYSTISFNFGPTLISWLEKNQPDIYQNILQADKKSQLLFCGHGSAIAQCYNHMIMPLANSRDKKTQILWGIRDFEYRFQRKPKGMWLPETAVDDETLEILCDNNIQFIILSPFQARNWRSINETEWKDVLNGKIDPQYPYLAKLPSGRSIACFFYQGAIAQEIAFSNLLENGSFLANRLLSAFSNAQEPKIINIAVDGETFGHHKAFGDMALAYALHYIRKEPSSTMTVYSLFLEKNPPSREVQLIQNSAWSCAHGVGRWSRDCGCCIENKVNWNQQWREHLRNAMDWLRDQLSAVYQEHMSVYTNVPWDIRDQYIEIILNRSFKNIDIFFKKNNIQIRSLENKSQILKLLEMQRHAMLMYTSCGWFFDDISGIETIQILSYAARAIQIAKESCNVYLEEQYVSLLSKAKSNEPHMQDGAYIYQTIVKPQILDLKNIAIDFIISSLFEEKNDHCDVYSYYFDIQSHETIILEEKRLSIGQAKVVSKITLEQSDFSFVALHLFDHKIIIGFQENMDKTTYMSVIQKLKEAFTQDNILVTQNLIESFFIFHDFSFWDLFKDDQRTILKQLLWTAISDIKASLENIHELHYSVIKDMKDKNIAIPPILMKTLDLLLNTQLAEILKKEEFIPSELRNVVEKIRYWAFELDQKNITYLATQKIEMLLERFCQKPEDKNILGQIIEFFDILSPFSLPWNLWKSQNLFFSWRKSLYFHKKLTHDVQWMELFQKIEHFLKIKA